MKRSATRLLAMLLLAGALAACAPMPDEGSYVVVPSSVAAPQPDAPQPETEVVPLHAPGTLRACAPANWVSANGVSTTRGFYEVERVNEQGMALYDEAGSRLVYTDYATRQQTVLCANAGCSHAGETCPAWLPMEYSGYQIFEAAGQLILVGRLQERYDEETDSTVYTSAWVEAMDYDGKSRRRLASFEDRVNISPLATDDTWVYLLRTVYKPETEATGDSAVMDLVTLDLETGELVSRYALENADEYYLGLMGNELVFSSNDFSGGGYTFPEGEGFPVGDAAYYSGHTLLAGVDATTFATRQLDDSLPVLGLGTRQIDGEWLYYGLGSNEGREVPQTFRLNLNTGEHQVFLAPPQGERWQYGKIVEDRLLLLKYQDEEDTEPDFVWMDISTRQEHPLNLFIRLPMYQSAWPRTAPMFPLEQAGDYYLVMVEQLDVDGVYVGMLRGLIAREDYWNGVNDILPITRLE